MITSFKFVRVDVVVTSPANESDPLMDGVRVTSTPSFDSDSDGALMSLRVPGDSYAWKSMNTY